MILVGEPEMNYTGATDSTGSPAATTSITASFTSTERKAVIDEGGTVAEEFYKLYYKTLEHRPHRVPQLYLDTAVMIWDGNPHVHMEAIQKFYDDLPSITFVVVSMDAHPLPAQAVGGNKTFMITTTGSYRIATVGTRNFSQNFVITANGDKWKIASNVFRSQISTATAAQIS